MKFSLLIPIFNERNNLGELLTELHRLQSKAWGGQAEILLIDDGSTDGSREVLEGRELPEGCLLVTHSRNRGYGAALKTGLSLARHDIVAIADADQTYPLDALAGMVRVLETAPEVAMIVGARTDKRAKASIPLARRPAKFMLTRLAEYLAGRRIPDLNSGMRVFRHTVVKPYIPLTPEGFSFTTTITLALLTNAHEVRWTPIDYRVRGGESKIRPIRDTLGFLQLILRTVMYFNPLKIFLPASLTLFFVGVGLLIARWLSPHPSGVVTTVVVFAAALQLLAVGLLADLIDKRLR